MAVQYPALAIGQRLTSDFIASMIDKYSIKGSDTDRASVTALANDADITTDTLDINATYEIEMNIGFSGLIAAGIKTAWSLPTSATGNRSCMGGFATAAGATGGADFMQSTFAIATLGVTYQNPRNNLQAVSLGGASIREVGVISTSTTAGAVVLQWAQNASNATATRIYAGSYIRWRRIA